MHSDWKWIENAEGKAVGITHYSMQPPHTVKPGALSLQELFELRDLMHIKFGLWTGPGYAGGRMAKIRFAIADLLEAINNAKFDESPGPRGGNDPDMAQPEGDTAA